MNEIEYVLLGNIPLFHNIMNVVIRAAARTMAMTIPIMTPILTVRK